MSPSSIGAGKAGGYARYLEGKTIAPERGDYYLAPDGSPTEASGRWLSERETLERLGIDPNGPVVGREFIALMEGRDPGSGRWLRPAGADGSRGGGVDVTFSAPKSVSVVWALSDQWQREQIEAAHARAVQRAVAYMREQVPLVRRRYEGQVVVELAKDLVATEYQHTTARGTSAGVAPDPQLHSHVVITGVVREDERFVAVASRPVFRAAREVGAFYRSALAEELQGEGYAIERGTGNGAKYFEISGVPSSLRDAFSSRHREIVAAAERFRAKHGRAPERGEIRELALENRRAKDLQTRGDLQRAWARTAERFQFGPDEAVRLIGAREPDRRERPLEDAIESTLTEREAIFEPRQLRAVALEQSAGEVPPGQALALTRSMLAERRILTLEGGRMTTLAVRAQEHAIERRAVDLAEPAGRDVGDPARAQASRQVAERLGATLSNEQEQALAALTGPERLGVLIGPAGTGKGVVIDAVARAEQTAARETFGIAVSGSTAERLGQDSPALAGQTMTLDALVARAEHGRVQVGPETTVILDEAGMVDHARMENLTALVERAGAKLIAVGDGRQLPSIGPGGIFDRLASHANTAALGEIRRTTDPAERKAWVALRAGEPERAMAHYRSQGRLFFQDTRDQAAERAVQRWAKLTEGRDPRTVALIADSSNVEIDRLNARAQHLRVKRGELGDNEIPLSNRHYGLREGDLMTFTAQYRRPGTPKVENGTRGEVIRVDAEDRSLTIAIDGSDRQVRVAGEDLAHLRLAYAQHVYRQQGATVDHAVILTGGWQTSRESAYVQASRARHGSEWILAREDLGTHGQDDQRVERLARKISASRRHTATLRYREAPGRDLGLDVDRPRTRDLALMPERLLGADWNREPGRTPDRSR